MISESLLFGLSCGVVASALTAAWRFMVMPALASRKADACEKRIQAIDQKFAVERAKDPVAFDKMVAEYEASRQ